MGYDLIPVNKKVDEISIGAIGWPLILQETGMGYVLGYGQGMRPGSYVFNTGGNGSPVSNEGYKVNATQAKAMAMVGRGFLSVQRFVNKEWEGIPEKDRDQYKKSSCPTYRQWWHEDRLKQIEQFCEFAEQSKGFKIC